jgi:hypothetical protein
MNSAPILEVDDEVTCRLDEELKRDDWDVMK